MGVRGAAEIVAPVPLSGCSKDANNNVTIGSGGCGPNVYVDQSFTGSQKLGKITIASDGGLAFLHDGSFDLETTGIEVNGLLSVGTSTCSVGNDSINDKITIRFLGSKPTSGTDHSKGIIVNSGGILRMFGRKGVPVNTKQVGISWTYLADAAGPATPGAGSAPTGTTVLQLADPVDWQPNDWIVVGTSTFSPFESEFVQIQTVTPRPATTNLPAGSMITLNPITPLVHYHFGGPAPSAGASNPNCKDHDDKLIPASFCDGADRNYGVDERAEVGLVTRSVKLTSDTSSSAHWGGEIMVMAGFKEVSIQGVEIEKFGKDQLASYPIHFHKAGALVNPPDAPIVTVNANSVHHSYNKCMTIHSTSNLTIQNNVCARIVGHIFYEEIGDEAGISFQNNLGLGAMSHYFGLAPSVPLNPVTNKPKDFWEGDYLGNNIGYDGFGIPNTDDQTNPTHSSCYTSNGAGGLAFANLVPCTATQYYVEPASGFWLVNPSAVLQGNSIGGCQGVGVGYWYLPPSDPPTPVTVPPTPPILHTEKFQPVGLFKNNRAHACYDGIFGETQFGVKSEQLQPRVGGVNAGKSLIARFDGFTSTRNRDRGVWMRPVWFLFENARLATNRDDVSLLSSGGNDGNGPGVWAMLKDSVLVGLSRNNVDRFGPCPANAAQSFGCVDHNPQANDEVERGYPIARWNMAGYYIYDGPVRMFHDRFVNFNKTIAPSLTTADQTTLAGFTNYPNANTSGPYEGDAALGWFQNNQSAYPTATVARELVFENVDLRHQIFTEKVNFGNFDDGDKNTAILDEDGSLTGFQAVNSTGVQVPTLIPISLNNLPFNASSNSVDECHAQGGQDGALEGRPTSLISPGNMGTLEFGALFPARDTIPIPPTDSTQLMTFAKDSTDYGAHQTMTLHSRNGQGIWEPKVTSGFGYTISAAPALDKNIYPNTSGKAGIPNLVDVGVGDVVKPGISKANPFYVRLGICYTNQDGSHPAAGHFTITRGYKSYGGNAVNQSDADLQLLFNYLDQRFQGQTCINLDDGNARNLDPNNLGKGCPANGVTAKPTGGCPADSSAGTAQDNNPACIYSIQCTQGDPNCPCPGGGSACGRTSDASNPMLPIDAANTMTPADDIKELTNTDGTFKNLNAFYYDQTTGMLFFYVTQDSPNAFGASPLGSCSNPPNPATDDPACPNLSKGESYYSCPKQGCTTYIVKLNDSTYNPGPSKCPSTDPTAIYGVSSGIYAQPVPPNQNKLVYVENISNVVTRVQPDPQVSGQGFQHSVAAASPVCPNPTPTATPGP